MQKQFRQHWGLLALLATTACGGQGTTDPLPSPPTAASAAPLTGTAQQLCQGENVNGKSYLVLVSDKSYVQSGSSFSFQVGFVNCANAEHTLQPLPTGTTVVMQGGWFNASASASAGYRRFDNTGLLNAAGTAYEATWTWNSPWSATVGAGSRISYTAPSAAQVMVFKLLSVTPLPAGMKSTLVESPLVRVNYNTRLGLMDVKQYYGSAGYPNRDISFSGVNFTMGTGTLPNTSGTAFNTRLLDLAASASGSLYGRSPGSANPTDRVWLYLKSNRWGYHQPVYRWTALSAPGSTGTINFWDSGFTNIHTWTNLQTLSSSFPSERAFVSNAFEMYQWNPNQRDTPPCAWNDPNAFAPNSACVQGGETKRFEVAWMAMPDNDAPNNPWRRNYFLAPEYIADGWGMWLTFEQGSNQRQWYALANILERRMLPDDGSTSTEPMLLLRYYEGSPGAFTTAPASTDWAHREDTYVTTAGITRVEGRRFGDPYYNTACSHWSCQRRQLKDDADAFHHIVLTAPNYCMTAAGSCLVKLNGQGRDKWQVLYQ
ncbi:hypothetical protein ACN28E_32140 [Archangium lansingense]|uniref:hypothetical protein n=1 Tax=Archangium lansingense TaxID=2995310 RepID=UPI003B768FA1